MAKNERWHVITDHLIIGNGEVMSDAALYIDEGKIVKVDHSENVKPEKDCNELDAREYTVMPGMWDAHIHLIGARTMNILQWLAEPTGLLAIRASVDARKVLECGFTSVRDLGSGVSFQLKKAINEGTIIGPRIFAAGKMLSQKAGHGDVHSAPEHWVDHNGWLGEVCDGVDECRRAVRRQLRQGADVIKLCTTGGILSEVDLPHYSQFSKEELMVVVDEAHRFGKLVAAHAQGTDGIRAALEAGVDTIEHGIYLTDELADEMVEKNVIFVPTIAVISRIVRLGEQLGVAAVSLEKARKAFKSHQESVRLAIKKGVPIASGSDFLGPELAPHGENAVELNELHQAGLKPMAVIQAATGIAARTAGKQDELGTLENGKIADLLFIRGNPDKDITVLTNRSNVALIMKEGQLLIDKR